MKPMQAIVSAARRRFTGAADDVTARPTAACKYARAGVEPTLDEALQDPVVQLMVRADRLELAEVRRVLAAARERASWQTPAPALPHPCLYADIRSAVEADAR